MKGFNRKIMIGLFFFLFLMLGLTLVSRGIYGTQLAQVSVAKPMRMALEHKVETAGNVKQARELAVNVPAGMRVSEVFVIPGDRVEEGQALFSLDTDYLQEKIGEKQLELKKLNLQIVTLEHNLQLMALEKNRQMQRAGEDAVYDAIDAQRKLERAREDERYANGELDEHSGSYPSQEYEQEIWEDEQKALANQAKEAQRNTEDAETNKAEVFVNSVRELEDALSQEQTDATLGLYRMQKEQINSEIAAIRSYTEENAVITAKTPGIITGVSVSAGENTTDGAALIFADSSVPLQFEVVLDKEQKKYVDPGADAEITLGSAAVSGKESIPVTVDYLTELKTMPGNYTAIMVLPEGKGTVGQGGTFTLKLQTDINPCCITLDALHMDENKRYFVYVLREENTILGTELAAEKRMVEVLDKNDRYAAIEPGAVDEATELIVAATKEFGDGDIVRRKE